MLQRYVPSIANSVAAMVMLCKVRTIVVYVVDRLCAASGTFSSLSTEQKYIFVDMGTSFIHNRVAGRGLCGEGTGAAGHSRSNHNRCYR